MTMNNTKEITKLIREDNATRPFRSSEKAIMLEDQKALECELIIKNFSIPCCFWSGICEDCKYNITGEKK